jgi:protein-S-isoprenylcysteine O-methyltransferase Ste14
MSPSESADHRSSASGGGRNRYVWYVLGSAAVGAVFGALVSTKLKPAAIKDLVQPLWISFGLYMFFSLYWTVAAKKSAPVKSSEPVASTALHQLVLNASILLLFLRVPGLRGRFLPPDPLLLPIGVAIQAAAVALAIWARRHLGANWSAAVTAKVGHQLIRTGPYRLIRHPIYTAMFGMHIGIAIASGEWHALVGVLLLAIAYSRKIGLEEQTMRQVFGAEYDAYRHNSWALVPWVL